MRGKLPSVPSRWCSNTGASRNGQPWGRLRRRSIVRGKGCMDWYRRPNTKRRNVPAKRVFPAAHPSHRDTSDAACRDYCHCTHNFLSYRSSNLGKIPCTGCCPRLPRNTRGVVLGAFLYKTTLVANPLNPKTGFPAPIFSRQILNSSFRFSDEKNTDSDFACSGLCLRI